MEELRDIAAVVLLILAGFGFFDGIYYHLWKLKLYRWRETRREHLIHSLRAVLFPVTVYLLFAVNSSGWLFYAAGFLAFVDLGIQQWDLIEEKKARDNLGGLDSAEYSVHVWATGLHILALALVVLAKPAAALAFSGPLVLPETSALAVDIAWFLLPGSIAIAVLHLVLLHPHFSEPTVYEQTDFSYGRANT